MICHLYWTIVEELPAAEVWDCYREQLPESLAQRLKKYPTLMDRHQSLCGKLLLQRGINQLNGTSDTDYLKMLQYTSKGRPYLPGGSGSDFNLSHSGTIVVCALTKQGRLGVDVQQVVPIPCQLAQLFLSKQVWERISQTATNEQLVRMWAKKEAVGKSTGDGLSLTFSSISLDQDRYSLADQPVIYTKEIDIHPGYACFIAGNRRIREVTINYVPVYELLLNMSVYC